MNLYAKRINLFQRLEPGSVGVEVGVLRGEFSAEILKTGAGLVYLVDPWCRQGAGIYDDPVDAENHEQNMRDAIANTGASGANRDRVAVCRGLSAHIATTYPLLPIDWVYLDGNHSYANVMEDLIVWSRKLGRKGLIMGHDYTENARAKELGFGVVPAVTDFCRNCGWEIEALTTEDFASYCLERK